MMGSKYTCSVDARHKGNIICLLLTVTTVYYAKGCAREGAWCMPRDCRDVQEMGFTTSGLHHVTPVGTFSGYDVWCDLDTEGGGWLVFQRRLDGSVDFYRNWSDYQRGFGDQTKEHWLGNLALHAITSQGLYELRVELEDWEGNKTFAQYDYFKVGAYEDKYRLAVSGYSGDAGDSLGFHDGMVFDTPDIAASSYHWPDGSLRICTNVSKGAWWYYTNLTGCYDTNLNGDYHANRSFKSVNWEEFRGSLYSLKRTEMKLRTVNVSWMHNYA